jgi:hypothetical protein
VKLLDTSVVVDHLRGYPPATALLERWVSDDEPMMASELTRFELLTGLRPGEEPALESMFSVLDWIPVTEQIARRAGTYAREFRRSHSGIGAVDYLLAATATAVGGELVTTNVKHFPMFTDLRAPYGYDPPIQRQSPTG